MPRSLGKSWLRSGAVAAVAAAVLVPLLTASGATPPPYPGLPAGKGFQWAGVAQRGYGVSERAQQAFWVPPNVATADVLVTAKKLADGTVRTDSTNYAYFVSPAGAAQPYGEMRPITVRTMAFGSIPVEVQVHLSQSRGADGELMPIALSTGQTSGTRADGVYRVDLSDSQADVDLSVRLSDLVIDDVPVALGPDCRTATPAHLTLRGQGYTGFTSEQNQAATTTEDGLSTYYAAGAGGRLTGNVVLPAFAGCGVGEDLSALLTTAVSGPQNPVVLQLTGPACDGQVPLKGIAPGDGEKLETCFDDSASSRAALAAMDDLRLPHR